MATSDNMEPDAGNKGGPLNARAQGGVIWTFSSDTREVGFGAPRSQALWVLSPGCYCSFICLNVLTHSGFFGLRFLLYGGPVPRNMFT